MTTLLTQSARRILGVYRRAEHDLAHCEGSGPLLLDLSQFTVTMMQQEMDCTFIELQNAMAAMKLLDVDSEFDEGLSAMIRAESGVPLN